MGLSDASFTRSTPARKIDRLRGDGLVGLAVGKQPLLRAFPAPIGPQQIQQPGRQQGLSVFVAFAAAYPEGVAGAIDVTHLEFGDLGDPGPGGIHGGQQGLDFFPTQLRMIGSFRSFLGNGIRSMLTCRFGVCV